MKLHPQAPQNLKFPTDWGGYEDKIARDFERSVAEDIWMGEPPDHEIVSVGSYLEKPALITRNYHASECDMMLWNGLVFPRSLEVCSNVFIYPEKQAPGEDAHFDEWVFIFEKILWGDGKYDIFNDQIPDDFIWTIDIMTGEDEQIVGQEEPYLKLLKFITQEIGGVKNIFDSRVRKIVEEKIINNE